MAALTVEHLKVLMVEHLKVMAALTVEHAYASLSVEHLKVMAALTVEHANAFNLLLFFLTYLRGK